MWDNKRKDKSKDTTCATVLISQDKKHILFGKIAYQDKYDLPKGRKEYSESDIEAAIRELQEETGIIIPRNIYTTSECKKIFKLNYNNDKNISLFFIYDKNNEFLNEENLKNLKCTTYFKLSDYKCLNEYMSSSYDINKLVPEIEDYKLLEINSLLNNNDYAKKHLNKSMHRVFKNKYVNKIICKIIRENSFHYNNNNNNNNNERSNYNNNSNSNKVNENEDEFEIIF